MRYASLSLDLDNQWSYMKTHGDAGWQSHPSYLDAVVPRILEFLAARRLTISFFIVGQDAALREEPRGARRDRGRRPRDRQPQLPARALAAPVFAGRARRGTAARPRRRSKPRPACKPRGFRGPGFSLSGATLETLLARGYDYDATVFPNLLNPLARAYLFSTSKLTAEEKEQRSALFGTWKDALRPVRPFRWNLQRGRLLEIPVTTLPGLKVPMHLSYLIYLAKFSRLAARTYLRFALGVCGLTATSPSILLHPLDFMGREDCPELAFFPGMDLTRERKMAIMAELFDILASRHELVTMGEHARRASASRDELRTLAPAFTA